MRNYGNDKKSAFEAKFEAQKLAFAAIAFQAVKALRDLGILTVVEASGKEGLTVEEIAEKVNLSRYGALVLLEAGLSNNVVWLKDDKYILTKTGHFILNDTLTKVNMDFTNDVCYEGMFKLKESVQEGRAAGLEVFGDWDTIYEGLSKLPNDVQKSWFDFDHYYSDLVFPHALEYVFKNNPKRIMDVGGNTGKWAITCAKHNPDVKVTILDLPGQLEMAAKNIKENGFEGRVEGHPINLLDHSNAFPKGHDVIWMSQFLDCFGEDDILELLKRAEAALDDEGALFINETYWDKQKYEPATYSLHHTSLYFTALANGTSRMYHSEDMYKLVEAAGLEVVDQIDDMGVSHTILKCMKKRK
ncbi:MAG: methyltransferase [Bacteroidales bacterium]|jgi:ubiquinone/menaquinone biosynthesis C-methylase UbiE|nr:methyltransferase [Bacteroidales bacterium]